MEFREIGRSRLQVAPLALGGNVFGWTADEKAGFAVLDAFVDAGFNLIDTANVYSRWAPGHVGGESETLLGRWLKQSGKRSQVVLATKVGMEMGPGRLGLGRKHILEEVEASLNRLQTDYIDLYQAHKDDPDTPLEETLSTFAVLMESGKVRAIGASNFSASRLKEALEVSERLGLPSYACLQPEYNLYARAAFEEALQTLCIEEQLGVIPYFSLASGFLTGKYRTEADFGQSVRGSSMGKYLNARGLAILAALDEVAAVHACSQASIALAWLMARPGITAPIASATTVTQLLELTKAATITLTTEEMNLLNEASAY